MKKALFTLFTLLVFAGSAWAECTVLNDKTEKNFFTIGSQKYTIDTTNGAKPYQLTFEAKCVPFALAYGGNLKVAQYIDGNWSDAIFSETPPKNTYKSYGPINIDPKATKIKLYTTVGATGYKYFKNVKITKFSEVSVTTTAISFPDTQAGTTCSTTKDISVFYSAPTDGLTITSVPTGFSVNSTTVISKASCDTRTVNVTVTFSPSSVGSFSGNIVFSNGSKVNVSGNGTLAAPTNLAASDVKYTSAKLTWNPVSGATKYNIYKSGDLVASPTTNSYNLSDLQWGVKYETYTVKAFANNTESAPSNGVSFTTPSISVPTNLNLTGVSYQEGTLSWDAVKDATSYNVLKDGTQVATGVTATSYKFTKLTQGTTYNVTVQAVYNGKATASATAKALTTLSLAVPTLSCTAPEYKALPITWNNITDAAGGYDLYIDGAATPVQLAAGTTSYTLSEIAMHSSHSFVIYSKLSDGTHSLTSDSKNFTTKDLAASASFTVSDASYTSVKGTWSAIPDATGYKIISNNGVINIFDGAVTSGTLVGLLPNNTYTFDVYGMYGDEVSLTHKTSNSISTLTTNCPAETSFGTQEIENKGGFDWEDKYSATLHTERNQATIGFSFEADNGSTFREFFAQESADGTDWTKISGWESSSKSGSGQITLKRGNFYFRFVYSGNFGAEITNISSTQGVYMEVPTTTIDFGTALVGQDVASKTVTVNYSTMKGDVESANPVFSPDKTQVGADDCGFGSEDVTISVNTAVKPGTYESTVSIGASIVPVKVQINPLPAPVTIASPVGKSQINVSWSKVTGATAYKVICEKASFSQTISETGKETYNTLINGLSENTEYEFKVITLYNEIESTPATLNARTYSSLIIKKDGVAPESTTYTVSCNGNWNPGENSFENGSQVTITSSNSASCTQFDKVVVGSTAPITTNPSVFTINEPVTATIYYADKDLTAPVVTTSCGSKSKIQLNWNLIDCATNYTVYVDGVEKASGLTTNAYLVEGLNEGTEYSFTVKAVSSLVDPKESAVVKETTYTTIALEKSGVSPEAATGTWSGEEGKWNSTEESFKLGSQATLTASITAECVTFDKIKVGDTDYTTNPATFTVAKNQTATIYYKNSTPEAPTSFTASSTSKSKVDLSWGAVACAKKYNVYYSNGTLAKADVEGTSCTIDNLEMATEYTFYVKAVNADKESEPSASQSATTYTTVGLETSGVSPEAATGEWSGEEGKWNSTEESFKLGSQATLTASTTAECVTFDKIKVGSTDYTTNPATFTVAKNQTATIYYKSSTPEAPTSFTASSTSKSKVDLSWNAVACAEKYNVYYSNGTLAKADVIGKSCTIDNLEMATEYTFYVTAVNADKESEPSAEQSATTYTTVTVTNAGTATTQTTCTWNGVTGEWNSEENSFKLGSQATLTTSNTEATFVKIEVGTQEFTTETATFEVTKGVEAKVYYNVKVTGAAKTADGTIFQTLTDAITYSVEHGNQEITLLNNCEQENIVLPNGSNLTMMGEGYKVGNVTVENGGKITIGSTLITGDLNIKTEYRNSGEVNPNGDNLQVKGRVSFDKILDPKGSVNSKMYYGFSVPFIVNVDDMYAVKSNGSEVKLEYTENYFVYKYDGEKRASTGKGWVTLASNATLEPGKMYLMASRYDNVIRFYKSSGAPIVSGVTQLTMSEFPATESKNKGWNALGNSQIFHVDAASETQYAQVLKNGTLSYDVVKLTTESFAVAAPFFIQYESGSKNVELSMKSHASLRSVEAEDNTFNLCIASGLEYNYDDQLFLTASDEASSNYVIGKDLAKMGNLTGVEEARIWMSAKSTNLCVMDAPLTNGKIEIPLGIYAPKAGNYNLFLNSYAYGLDLELLHNGEIIHTFADGNYTTALAKGSNSGYSLKVSVDTDSPITTDVVEVNGISAYIAERTLYISGLNDGDEFTVYNLQNKVASGKANGGVEKVALPMQGVYILVSGDTTIKLLNK